VNHWQDILSYKTQILEKNHFVWTLHHALYDFWSLSLILRSLNETYQDQKPKNSVGFNTYIKHLVEKSNSQASEDYWRSSLQGAAPSGFPPSPPTSREPQPDSALHHIINVSSIQDTSAEFTDFDHYSRRLGNSGQPVHGLARCCLRCHSLRPHCSGTWH